MQGGDGEEVRRGRVHDGHRVVRRQPNSRRNERKRAKERDGTLQKNKGIGCELKATLCNHLLMLSAAYCDHISKVHLL